MQESGHWMYRSVHVFVDVLLEHIKCKTLNYEAHVICVCVLSIRKTETSAIDHRTAKLVYTPISLEELTLREE